MSHKTITALIAACAASFPLLWSSASRAETRSYEVTYDKASLYVRCEDDAGDPLVDDHWLVPLEGGALAPGALDGVAGATVLEIQALQRPDAVRAQLKAEAGELFASAEVGLGALLASHPDRISVEELSACSAATPISMSLVDTHFDGERSVLGEEDCQAADFTASFDIDLVELLGDAPKYLDDTVFTARISGDEGAQSGAIELAVNATGFTADAALFCAFVSTAPFELR